ncbi:MAG: SpaH/EbpB family LPXTG-anchored major pilin [Clostridiales bacterium]|nr:SpaH/EbpB family LPXTG-anchored major pilin [Clostridiales bacterium]
MATLDGTTVYTNITTLDPFTSLQSDIEVLSGQSKDSTGAVALAETAAKMLSTATAKNTSSSGTLTVSETGYYLIVETLHGNDNVYLSTKYLLVAVDGDESVEIKTSVPTVTKKIVSEHNSETEDANTVAIDDVVTYKLEATIPSYDDKATNITFQLVDTLSGGLTFGSVSSIAIGSTTYTVGGENNNCSSWIDTSSIPSTGGGGSFTITIPSDIVVKNGEATVTVIFTATLNDGANVGEEGNPNSVHLVYSNNYYGDGSSSKTTTEEDTVITYTGLITIKKVSSDGNSALTGAEFDIYKVVESGTTGATTLTVAADQGETDADNNEISEKTVYVVKVDSITTGTDGTASAKGLDIGTYYAVETKAPEGYSLDDTPVKIELTEESTALTLDGNGDASSTVEDFKYEGGSTANSNTISNYKVTWKTNNNTNAVEIENTAGMTLPGTGGMGTTLFTFGGLALVILAAVMFIVYTKKQRKQA